MGFFNGKDEPEQGFTVEDLEADAARLIEILRALIAEFVDEKNQEPLTRSDISTVHRLPLDYLEEGAALCGAAPEVGITPHSGEKVHLTRAANVAYEPVFETSEKLTRLIREAMWRKTLEAISITRAAHRRADLLVESGEAPRLKRHVDRLRRLAARPWRRKRQRS